MSSSPSPSPPGASVRVHAPGRVNLIGEHTDYTGGLVFPMAISRGTTLVGTSDPSRIELTSDDAKGTVSLPVPVTGSIAEVRPRWGRLVAGMATECGAARGISGHLTSDIPAGAGLSSSAALMCAIGLAIGFEGTPLELALAAQRAEHAATGVPTGIMDQYCIAAAKLGHAALIDCDSLEIEHVPIPDDLQIVVRFIAHRTLEGSEYTARVTECQRAESMIGPLRAATVEDVAGITDPLIRRRARHVVTENQRVRDFTAALRRADHDELGRLLREGHASLRDDYETSTPAMDEAVAATNELPGVFGARMTGGGFGGCLVALCEPGALTDGWVVTPSAGARVLPSTE